MLFFFIVSILVISPWLYPYFIILWALLITQVYDYKISNPKTMIYHLSYVIIMFSFGFYVFFIRLARVGKSFKIYDVWDTLCMVFWELYYELPTFLFCSSLILVILYVLLALMISKVITLYLKKTVLSLYIYMLQYEFFEEFIDKYQRLNLKYTVLLVNKIKNKKNLKLYALAYYIWPRSHYFFEKLLYVSLIPTLFIYDWWFYHGQISKIFVVLPWYYIYSVLRVSKYMFDEFLNYQNIAMSQKWYGFKRSYLKNEKPLENVSFFDFFINLVLLILWLIMVIYLVFNLFKSMESYLNINLLLELMSKYCIQEPKFELIFRIITLIIWIILGFGLLYLYNEKINLILRSTHELLLIDKIYKSICEDFLMMLLKINQKLLKFMFFIQVNIKVSYIFMYLLIYDYIINFGVVNKIFILLPWYVIFAIIKKYLVFWKKLCKVTNLKTKSRKYDTKD